MHQVDLMVKVAKLYYEDEKTQQKIADELGLTRLRVIELLKKAKTEGIIRIKIIDPTMDYAVLEDAISDRYGLRKVIIVPESFDKASPVNRGIGRAASVYLNEVLKFGDILGIGWGLLVTETINSFEYVEKRDITVVPLIGGGSASLPQYDVNNLVQKASLIFGGNYFLLHAPALVDSKEICNTIKLDRQIKRIYNFWNNANVILVGIGAIVGRFSDPLNKHLEIQSIDFQGQEIAGDICCKFFNTKGEPVALELYDRMLGIDLNMLQKVDNVIGVAGGLTKFNAILGAVRGKYINVLITDEPVARRLMT
jgi:deoxyribonucleoside regulator